MGDNGKLPPIDERIIPTWDKLLVREDPESKMIATLYRPDVAQPFHFMCSGVVLRGEAYRRGTRIAYGRASLMHLENERRSIEDQPRKDETWTVANLPGVRINLESEPCRVGLVNAGDVWATFAPEMPDAVSRPLDGEGAEYARAPWACYLVERFKIPDASPGGIEYTNQYTAERLSAQAKIVDRHEKAGADFAVGDVVLVSPAVQRRIQFGITAEREFYVVRPEEIVARVFMPTPGETEPAEASPFRYRGPIQPSDEPPRLEEGDTRLQR